MDSEFARIQEEAIFEDELRRLRASREFLEAAKRKDGDEVAKDPRTGTISRDPSAAGNGEGRTDGS